MKFKHPFDITFRDYDEYAKFLKKQKLTLNGQIMRNHGLGLINWGLRLHRLVYAKAPSKSIVKVLKHFSYELHRIYKNNGMGHLVKYLKTASVMLQQYVARHEFEHSSREIGKVAVSSTKGGLPRIIPRLQRELIRKGRKEAIIFWISLLNIYRYLECKPNGYPLRPGNSIEREGINFVLPENIDMYISQFWSLLSRDFHAGRKPLSDDIEFPISSKGAPHTGFATKDVDGKDYFFSATSFYSVLKSAQVFRLLEGTLDEYKERFYESVRFFAKLYPS